MANALNIARDIVVNHLVKSLPRLVMTVERDGSQPVRENKPQILPLMQTSMPSARTGIIVNHLQACYFRNSHLMGAMTKWFPTCVLPASYLRPTDVFIRVATVNGMVSASDMEVDNFVT